MAGKLDPDHIMIRTLDPETLLVGHHRLSVPALTSLLISVCKNDPTTFDEACRLIRLFIEEDRKHDG